MIKSNHPFIVALAEDDGKMHKEIEDEPNELGIRNDAGNLQ